jgi:hypothetical protein
VSASRCPNCAALLRSGDIWCSQCHADLRPPEERPAVNTPAPPTQPGAHRARHAKPGRVRTLVSAAQAAASELAQDPSPRAVEVVAEDDWVRAVQLAPLREATHAEASEAELTQTEVTQTEVTQTEVTQTQPADAAEPDYSVDVMLSLLAAERGDGLATWSNRLDGPGAKLAVVAGGALAITLVGFVGLAILGMLFG